MKERLTFNFVKNINPVSKRLIIYDILVPSLALFITPCFINKQGQASGGHKSFYYLYKTQEGTKKQLYIGSFPELTPNQAKEIVTKRLQIQVANGINPDIKAEIIKKSNLTINECLASFFEEYVSTHLKPNTYKNYYSLRKNYVEPALGNLTISAITHEHIQELHHELREKPTTANRVLALCSKFLNWCEKKGHLPRGSAVTKGLARYHEKTIRRFLSQGQMTLLWETVTGLERSGVLNQLPATAFKLLLLTGARKNEILSLKWADIEFESKKAILTDSKTGFKTIYFPQQAIDLLLGLPKTSAFIFPSQSASGHLSNLQWQWKAVVREAALEGRWRIHDLRHGFASSAVNSGGSLPYIGFLLGHKRSSTTERYAHVAENPAQALLDLVAKKIIN
jgi:integrase